MKELLFFESKNITDIELITKTALEIGLDEKKLITDMGNIAKVKFDEDLALADSLGVSTLPTLIFSNQSNDEIVLNGYQEFADLEQVILNLYPDAIASARVKSAIEMFQIYPSMATHEFSYLMGIDKLEAESVLEELKQSGKIQKLQGKSGTFWKLNS